MRLLVVFLLAASALPAAAQWQPVNSSSAWSSDELVSGPGFVATFKSDNEVYASRDGGQTWTKTGVESPALTMAQVLFARPENGYVYGWLDEVGGRWGFFRTADGVTWTRLNSLAQAENRRTPVWHKGTLYAFDTVPADLFALSADGSAWTRVNASFQSDVDWANLLGSAGDRLFLTTSYKNAMSVQYSDDGVTWSPSTDSLSYIVRVGSAALSVASPARFAFGTVNGVFKVFFLAGRRSTDGGRTWTGFALPPRANGESVLVDQFLPVSGDQVIASNAVWGEFWSSADAGATWQRMPDPLGTNRTTGKMATDGQYVFIWDKKDDRILRRPISDFFGPATAAEGAEAPAALRLDLDGPHPVRTALHLAIETTGPATLTVFDVLGRAVAAREVTASGAVALDASSWAPGLYVARLEAGRATLTRSFVVAR